VGIRHNVPPVSFAEPPRGRGGNNKLPLALLAAAPALHAADEAAAAAEAGRSGNAAVPQLLVEELSAAPSWELQAYMPGAATGAGAAAARGGSSSSSSSSAGYSRGGNGSHFQQQQQQQYNSSSKWGSGSGYKQERRGNGSSSSGGSMAPQSLPGSLGLVQQQLADVLQPQVGWLGLPDRIATDLC
jgi:cobalamin biosynthesis Mg chelatase CobN